MMGVRGMSAFNDEWDARGCGPQWCCAFYDLRRQFTPVPGACVNWPTRRLARTCQCDLDTLLRKGPMTDVIVRIHEGVTASLAAARRQEGGPHVRQRGFAIHEGLQ